MCLWGMLLLSVFLQAISSTDHHELDIQHILDKMEGLMEDYSLAFDAEADHKNHNLIVSNFHSCLIRLTQTSSSHHAYSDTLINKGIMATFKLRNHMVKNELSIGRSLVVNWTELGSVSSWTTDLLLIILNIRNLMNLEKNEVCVCKNRTATLTPLELAVKLKMMDIYEILIQNGMQLCHCTDCHDSSKTLQLASINQDVVAINSLIAQITSELASTHSGQQNDYNAVMCKLLTQTDSAEISPMDIAHFQCQSGLYCQVFEHLSEMTVTFCEEGYNPPNYNYPHRGNKVMCPAEHSDVHPLKDITNTNTKERWVTCIREGTGCDLGAWSGNWLVYGGHDVGRTGCDLLHLSAGNLTPGEFEKIFVNLSIPVVITGLTQQWSLLQEWRKDVLLERWADMDMLVGPIPYGEVFGESFGFATVREFLTYMKGYAAYASLEVDKLDFKAPLYVFDGKLLQTHFRGQYSLEGLNISLWKTLPHYSQFILGPAGSGAPFHFHCHAINALIYGRKKWFLYPPDKALYGKQHPLLWYRMEYSQLKQKPIECVQRAGDVIYVPSRWSHATVNMDECVGMAIELDTGDC